MRRLVVSVVSFAFGLVVACSTSAPSGATCGPGTQLIDGQCLPSSDGGSSSDSAADSGADAAEWECGAGKVCCGIGKVCVKQTCCPGEPGSCVTDSSVCLGGNGFDSGALRGYSVDCDGPEDCPRATPVCCLQAGASAIGAVSCTTEADCDGAMRERICHVAADCPSANPKCLPEKIVGMSTLRACGP